MNTKWMNAELFFEKKFDLKFELDQKEFKNNLYERLLDDLCKELNSLHNIKWSKRSWRIMIGPWLIRYLSSIHRLIINYQELEKNNQTNFIEKIKDPKNFVLTCNDLIEFSDNYQTKEFTYKFFSRLKVYFKNNEKRFNYLDHLEKNKNIKNKSEKLSYKVKIFFLKFFQRLLCSKNSVILYKIYFGNFFSTLILFFKLRQFPFKYNLFEKIPKFEINTSIRSKLNFEKSESNLYEKILRDFIIEIIPTNYIEGFKSRLKDAENSFLPKKAKIIYSCSIYSDYRFKYWACNQINDGAKLIYGQHGAAYNALIYDQRTEHEIKISDLFLSWGWTNKLKKVVPCGVFSLVGKSLSQNKPQQNKILYLPGLVFKPYETIFSRLIDIKNDTTNRTFQLEKLDFFMKKMKKENLKNFYLKPHPREKDYDFKISDFLKKYNEIKFLKKDYDPFKIVDDYDLVLFTNLDSTMFYYLISLNKPAVVLINNYESILNQEYKENWKEMIEAKIFHLTAESLYTFIENKKNNFNKWWYDPKTQKAVNNFSKINCKNEKNLISIIVQEIKKIQKNN